MLARALQKAADGGGRGGRGGRRRAAAMSAGADRDRPGHHRHPGGGLRRVAGRSLADAYRPVPVPPSPPGWVEKDAEAVVASVPRRWPRWWPGSAPRRSRPSVSTTKARRWWPGTPTRCEPWRRRSCGRAGAASRSSSGCAPTASSERVRELAGTPLDPYFSSTKITWLLENNAAVQAAAAAGRARFGTLDAYLLRAPRRRRPHRAVHRRPHPAAGDRRSRALGSRAVPDLRRRPRTLPPIGRLDRRSGGDRGSAAASDAGGPDRRPRRARLHRPGDAKATYGTGVFLLANAGARRPGRPRRAAPDGGLDDGRRQRLRAGRRRVLGRLGDQLAARHAGADRTAAETEALARSVPDTGGVRFLPALTGLAAPWWRSNERATGPG